MDYLADAAWKNHVGKLTSRNERAQAAQKQASKGKSKLSLFGSSVASSLASAVGVGDANNKVVAIPQQRPALPTNQAAALAAQEAITSVKRAVEIVDLFVLPKLLDASVPNAALATPLHVACRDGVDGLAKHLLSLKVQVDPKDRRGRTPLHLVSE